MSEKVTMLKEQFKSALNEIKTSKCSPQQTGIGKIINEIKEYDPDQYREVMSEYKPIFEEWRKNNPETKKKTVVKILDQGGHDNVSSRVRISIEGETKRHKLKIKNSIAKSKTRKIDPEKSYKYKGEMFGKGRLVHAVIKNYINVIKPGITLEEIHKDWENVSKNKYSVCNEFSIAKEHSIPRRRYFLNESEILRLADGTRVAVSKEWGPSNMPNFIERAKKLGIEIQEPNVKN